MAKVNNSLDELRKTEWCPMFEKLMRNRLLIGAMRYERFSDKVFAKDRDRYDILTSIRSRLDKYEKDHNLEHLVDCANLLMIEFINPTSRKASLRPIDDGEHTKKRRNK